MPDVDNPQDSDEDDEEEYKQTNGRWIVTGRKDYRHLLTRKRADRHTDPPALRFVVMLSYSKNSISTS